MAENTTAQPTRIIGTKPLKITPERIKVICDNIRAGIPRDTSAVRAGINPATLYNWLKRGREDSEGVFFDFAQEVARADADCEASLISRIQSGALGGVVVKRKTKVLKDGTKLIDEEFSRPDWNAASWLLERKYREKWSRTDRMELILEREAGKIAEELGQDAEKVISIAKKLAERNAS